VSYAGTVRGPSSPRGPIPTQWFPPSNAPNLATAQRAKERGHKKGSMSGSPFEAKALSRSRSLADISRMHSVDGTSFLTKTAYAAIESDLTTRPFAKSPTKHQRTLSKPAWNSPTHSSHRDGFQQPSSAFKTSPNRLTFVGADAVADGCDASSVAYPVGELVYRYPGKSPVRNSAACYLASS
jgi:hypothetical protein